MLSSLLFASEKHRMHRSSMLNIFNREREKELYMATGITLQNILKLMGKNILRILRMNIECDVGSVNIYPELTSLILFKRYQSFVKPLHGIRLIECLSHLTCSTVLRMSRNFSSGIFTIRTKTSISNRMHSTDNGFIDTYGESEDDALVILHAGRLKSP
jgi:hypothetical protein